MSIVAAVGWLFLVIFGLLAIVTILDMIGWVTFREPSQRKWLFGSLITSVVLAVSGLGTAVLRGSEPPAAPPPAIPRAEPAKGSQAVPPPQRPPQATVPAAGGDDRPGTPPAADAGFPEEFRAWAAEKLGARPEVPAAFADLYPRCAAELRERPPPAEIAPAEADDCRIALEAHRQLYFVPIYAERVRYGQALRREQLTLVNGPLGEEAVRRLDFLRQENVSFNYPEGEAFLRYQSAERRVNEDIELCRANRCAAAR